MRRIVLFAIVLLLLSVPCHALTLFQTDYDGDAFTADTVYDGDWLPLRELSEIFPYSVEWDEHTRTVYIYADRTWTIKPNWWIPPGVKIQNGVIYVSPKYMHRFVPNTSFMYNGELYVFDGESTESKLIKGDDAFRNAVLTQTYNLKLAVPDTYSMVRECLTGGIEQCVKRPKEIPENALAYVYPSHRKPTAHILSSDRGTNLSGIIAHESLHVKQHREDQSIDEQVADQLKQNTIEALLATR